MDNHQKIHIIYNPKAGNGKAAKLLPRLDAFLMRQCPDSEIYLTRSKNDATHIARKLIRSGARVVVAAGGDGTVNEVLNGFFDENGLINPECKLGIIRCGTGQGAALSFRIPENFNHQINLIQSSGFFLSDVGKVEFTDFENKRQVRYFISESQAGIGSSIAQQVHNGYKFLGGKLAFAAVSVKHIFTFFSRNFAVAIDENPEQNRKLIGIAIGNLNLTAGGMKLTPEASPLDGKLDTLFIHPMGLGKRLVNFSRIYSGNHIYNPNFSYHKCSQISIWSEKPVSVSADGELLGTTPFTIKIIPQAIKIISNLN